MVRLDVNVTLSTPRMEAVVYQELCRQRRLTIPSLDSTKVRALPCCWTAGEAGVRIDVWAVLRRIMNVADGVTPMNRLPHLQWSSETSSTHSPNNLIARQCMLSIARIPLPTLESLATPYAAIFAELPRPTVP